MDKNKRIEYYERCKAHLRDRLRQALLETAERLDSGDHGRSVAMRAIAINTAVEELVICDSVLDELRASTC